MLSPLGFNNTCALALREADAQRLGMDSLPELARLSAADAARLRLGMSHELLVRADGWPAFKRSYGLPLTDPPALDHGLAYQVLAQGQVDLVDVYSTDHGHRGGLRRCRRFGRAHRGRPGGD